MEVVTAMTHDASKPDISFHQAQTQLDSSKENLHEAPTERAMPVPVWPPTRDYRVPSRTSTPLLVLLIVLACALIATGLSFIVYSASNQYRHALRVDATVAVQSTRNTLATTQARTQATANTQSTAQANVEATITTQANDSATATATVDSVTATASAFSDLYSQTTAGTPVLNDPLTDNKGDGKWEGGSKTMLTGCAFANDGYHVSEARQGNFQPCFAQAAQAQFSNMLYQASITFIKGNRAQGGLLLRADISKNSYYFFHIGVDGSYAFDLYTSKQASTLTTGFSAAINVGLNQSNQLAVLAKGDHFYLYANGQYVDSVSDNTLTTGTIGLAVIDSNTPADALISNAQVWKV